MIQRELNILGKSRSVIGDPDYLGRMGSEFEPETTAILAALCEPGAVAIDIGANIGLTALVLSELCGDGQVIAIEPVPSTFDILNSNIATSGTGNIKTVNCAIGASEGSVSMYVDENNRATAFVVDIESKSDLGIPLATLDTIVDQQNISSLDFIKIDVEGCELEVLKGSLETIKRFKPVVLLEMNHWCLNVFRRVSLPEFHDNLFDVFPYVFAVDQGRYLDFSDPLNVGEIFRAHVFENKYMHIVAGFDKVQLISKLERIKSNIPFADHGPITLELPRTDSEIQLQALLDSTSWKITAPIRKVVTMLRSIL